MKRSAMAVVLACAFSVTTLAGDIPSTGIVSSPPPPIDKTATPGDIPSTGSTLRDTTGVDVSILLTLLGLAF